MSASDVCGVDMETSDGKYAAADGAKNPKSPSGSSAMVATVGVVSSPRRVMLIASADAKNSRLSRSSSASISASRPKENATVCASNSRTSCAETRPSPAISSVSASMASSLNCARSSRSTTWNRGALDAVCDAAAVTLPTSTSICRRRDMPSRSGWRSCDSASMWSPMASPAFRNISTIGLVSASLPFLTRSRIDSKSWVNSAKSRWPNAAAPPLTECTARKIAFSVSSSGASMSTATNSASSAATCSCASSKKAFAKRERSSAMRVKDWSGRGLRENFLEHLKKFFRIERFDHPAGGSCIAALLF